MTGISDAQRRARKHRADMRAYATAESPAPPAVDPSLRMLDDGSLACPHRDSSVCDACFLWTPALVRIHGDTFAYVESPAMDAIAAADPDHVRISPLTLGGGA